MIKLTQEREIEAATRSSRMWAIRQFRYASAGLIIPEQRTPGVLSLSALSMESIFQRKWCVVVTL